MQTETQRTSRLVVAWRKMRHEIINITGNKNQAPGWPDVCICAPNIWSGFIEFKNPNTPLQPHQKRIIESLERSTMNVVICRFLVVDSRGWSMQLERADGTTIRCLSFKGTDGNVAAGLLFSLKELAGE